MALSTENANLVWQKVKMALMDASPAVQQQFADLKMYLSTQGRNPDLQFIPFTETQAIANGGTDLDRRGLHRLRHLLQGQAHHGHHGGIPLAERSGRQQRHDSGHLVLAPQGDGTEGCGILAHGSGIRDGSDHLVCNRHRRSHGVHDS
jgi:hypothetical protein